MIKLLIAIALALAALPAAALNLLTGAAIVGSDNGQPVVYWYAGARFAGQTAGVVPKFDPSTGALAPNQLVCGVGYTPPLDPMTVEIDCLPPITGFAITGYERRDGRLQKRVEWYNGAIVLPSTVGVEPQYDGSGRLIKGVVVPGVGVVR